MGLIVGPDGKPIELLGSPQTADYRSNFDLSQYMSISVKRNPILTLMKMEEMLLDPFIRLGLSFKKAPVRKATIIVKAKDRAVREWVATNLRRFWRLPLRKLMRGYEYGFAGFEVLNELMEDVEGNKKIHFKGLKDFQPRDTTPLTFEGKIAGVRVRCPTTSTGPGGGTIDLIGPKALWYAHDMRAGNWFGRSVFLGCQSTYEELNGKDCARDSRFHWYYRHAFRGPTVRYPTQMYVKPGADGQLSMLSGRDIAMEIATLGKNGASIIAPNTRDPANGNDYLFSIDWPQQSTSSGMDIRDYVKDLRNEEWNGLELPDEIISADGTGALAGRRVPERAFYSACEDDLNEIIDWLVIQWMQPMAILNYGRDRGQFELMIGEIAPAQEAPGDNKEGEPKPDKDPLADWLGGEGTNDDPKPGDDGGNDDDSDNPNQPKPSGTGQAMSQFTAKRVQMWQPVLADDEMAMIRGEVNVSRKGRTQVAVAVKLSADGRFNIPIAGQSMLDTVTKIAAQRAMFLSNELKTKLVRLAVRNPTATPQEFLRAAARLIQQVQPRLAALVRDTIVAGWVMGAKRGSLHIPKEVQQDLKEDAAGTKASPLLDDLNEAGMMQKPVQSVRVAFYHPGESPSVNFPGIDEAFADLQTRHILESGDFYKLGDQARAAAFTVSHVHGIDTLEMIRDKLADAVSKGTSMADFHEAIGDAMDASPLGESHLETVFRNNTQSAASAGQETVINDPLVIDAFPYAIYEGIEDTRQRETHNEVMRTGIPINGEGSNIYRSDDPFWDIWTPPNGHRCRCGKTYITLRQAARLGVPEAKRWLETGTPPANPWYTKTTLQPDPGFAHRPTVGGSSVGLSRPSGRDLKSSRTMILQGRVFRAGDSIPLAVLDDLAVVRYFGPVRLSVVHAPPGGITVNGKEYKGGMFIPSGEAGAAKSAAKTTVDRVKGAWDGSNFHAASVKTKREVLKDLGYSADDADELAKSIDAADPDSAEKLYDEAFHAAPIHKLADADIDESAGDELGADQLNSWWSNSPDHFLAQLEGRLESAGVKSLKVTSIASEAADLVEAGEADKAAKLIADSIPKKEPAEKPVEPAPESKPKQVSLFTREQMTGERQLFDTGRDFVKDKPGAKPAETAASELEKIADAETARSKERQALPGQKTIDDIEPTAEELAAAESRVEKMNGKYWVGPGPGAKDGFDTPFKTKAEAVQQAVNANRMAEAGGGGYSYWDGSKSEKTVEPAAESVAISPVSEAAAPAAKSGNTKYQKAWHAKAGRDTHVVTYHERVDTATFNQNLAEAKKLGGYYSTFSKDGAVPGFQFKSEENARKFMEIVDGGESAETVGAATGAAAELRQKADEAAKKADDHARAAVGGAGFTKSTDRTQRRLDADAQNLQARAGAAEETGKVPEIAKRHGMTTWKQVHKAGMQNMVKNADSLEQAARAALDSVATKTDVNIRDAVARELVERAMHQTKISGNGDMGISRAISQIKDTGRTFAGADIDPQVREQWGIMADALRQKLPELRAASLGKTVEPQAEPSGDADSRYSEYLGMIDKLERAEGGYGALTREEWNKRSISSPEGHAAFMKVSQGDVDSALARQADEKFKADLPRFIKHGDTVYERKPGFREDEYKPVSGFGYPVTTSKMAEHVRSGAAVATDAKGAADHIQGIIDAVKSKADAKERERIEQVEAKVKAEMNRPATQVISEVAPPDGWKESDKVPTDPQKVRHELAVAAHGEPWKHTEAEWQKLAGGPVGHRYASAVNKAISAGEEIPDRVMNQPGQDFKTVKAYADSDRQFTADEHTLMKQPAHELTEDQFLEQQRLNAWRTAERNAIGWQRQINEMKPGKKRTESEASLTYWKKEAEELRKARGASTKLTGQKEYQRGKYRDAVKQAISKGLVTDRKIIDQYPEFQLARDARERYEKGRHTSFANKSIAVDDSMKEARGYKAKRQDGKPMTPEVAKYLSDGVAEVEQAVGALKELFAHTDVTLAHTNGKHPFLSTAGGLYSPGEKTVTSGIVSALGRPIKSLAHELGHWLDHEAGKAAGMSTRTTHYSSNSRSGRGKSIVTDSVAEANESMVHNHPEKTSLFQMAKDLINDQQEVRKLTTSKLSDAEGDLKDEVETAKVILGPYWRTPTEIWARLFEQYVADEHGHKPGMVSAASNYHKKPGWWKAEDFARLKPLVKKEIDRRVGMIQAAMAKAKGES